MGPAGTLLSFPSSCLGTPLPEAPLPVRATLLTPNP
jgi:hypothetical protein